MIRVRLVRDRLSITGHAHAGPRGEDVVCAAVSALGQALVYGLAVVAGIEVTVKRWEDGRLEADWDVATMTPEAAAILATMRGSLAEIAVRYGAHVELVTE